MDSYRCPLCTKWFHTKHALHGHLGSKHRLKGFEVTGSGPDTLVLQLGKEDSDAKQRT